MKGLRLYLCLGLLFGGIACLYGQGPPITSDKPIMLGAKRKVIKTLTEFRQLNGATFIRMPLMFNYLPSNKSLIAVHLPFVSAQYDNEIEDQTLGLGDIELMAKYQFFRKDGKAKTFRTVLKTIQSFPTGRDLKDPFIGLGEWQGYWAVVAGYETIKHGISLETGYKVVPEPFSDELQLKFGVGLPLLKPIYPVNQLNLYFEYNFNQFIKNGAFEMLYAQGIQYARKQLTYEASVQFPLRQSEDLLWQRDVSLFLGSRFVF